MNAVLLQQQREQSMGSRQTKAPSEEAASFVYKEMIRKSSVADPSLYYEFFEQLGEGCYSQVFKVRSRATGQWRAVKKMEKGKSPKAARHLCNQFQILRQMDHPNIVKMYEMFEDSTHHYMVTEYLEAKDALELLHAKRSISEELACSIFYQLVLAVNYLHRNKCMHRDIKLENVVYNEQFNSLKLIDFGSALRFEEGQPRERRCTGTIHYIAPEVINRFYNSKCDIWSLGILLFVLLSGNAPFVGKEHDTIIHRILNEPLHFANPLWNTRSSEAKQLISRMLEKNFEKRASIAEILSDPWLCRHRALNVIHKPERETIIDALEYMQRFTRVKLGEIQLGILVFMANVVIKFGNQVGLMKAFNRIDFKEDGEIDEEEVRQALAHFLELPSKKAEQLAREFISKIDLDASGLINYTEFIVSASNLREILTAENIQKTFEYIDTDGSGGLSIGELRARLGEHVEEAYYSKLVGAFEREKSGEISRKEFERMMLGILGSY